MPPEVLVVVGSEKDLPILESAFEIFRKFDIPFKEFVVSAHRTPEILDDLISEAEAKGVLFILAAAGAAAHLPGVIAAKTLIPVVGVPLPTSPLQGVDSLLSIVQMPAGIPVATMAIGEAGAGNGALYIVQLLALQRKNLAKKLEAYRKEWKEKIARSEKGFKPGRL